MRILVLMFALLTLVTRPATALDPDVSAQLERLANDPATDAPGLAAKVQDTLFQAVWTSCAEQQQTTQERCNMSRLLHVLDGTGVLLERCGALVDSGAIAHCTIAGAEALPIVAALGGNPRDDVDWNDAGASYSRLLEELKNAARVRCKTPEGASEAECLIKEQAALLGYPPAVGSYCASQVGHNKQGCLNAVRTLAVYLEAIERTVNSPTPL